MQKNGAQSSIFAPIRLPCGRTLKNRLVKVAMYEHMATFLGGPPNDHHFSLYSMWAKSDWGMVITGNVQVSSTHLALGRDMTLPDDISEDSLQPFEELVSSMHGLATSNCKCLTIMQLSHAGRQSPNFIGGRYPFQRPSGPSPVPVKPRGQGFLSNVLHAVAFQTPRTLSKEEIQDIIAAFVKGARVALGSGFDGVQVHAAHGYLLSQFISPKSNLRTDEYSSKNALGLLHQVVVAIRAVVPSNFVLGIKINAADYAATAYDDKQGYNPSPSDALDHIRAIASWALVDFIEISGGDYEKLEFTNVYKSPRQALFSTFSHQAVQIVSSLAQRSISSPPLVLLTGGLRTPELLYTALASRHAHLLGIGRGSVLCPHLPMLLKAREKEHGGDRKGMQEAPGWDTPFSLEPEFGYSWGLTTWILEHLPKIPLLGAGVNMAWYIVEMRRLSEAGMTGIDKDLGLAEEEMTDVDGEGVRRHDSVGAMGAVFWMWVWFNKATRDIILGVAPWCLVIFFNWFLR